MVDPGEEVRFAGDSPLEGDGLEPLVTVASEPVYIAEGELRGDRRGSQKNLAGYRWFESISLQRTVRLSPAATFERQEPGLSPQVCEARLTTGSAETQQAFHCAPTGGNVSAGPYSSTAVPMMRSVQCHDGPTKSGPGLSMGRSLNSDRAQAKPSRVHWSGQASGRRECSRSFSAVKSGGCRPSRIA